MCIVEIGIGKNWSKVLSEHSTVIYRHGKSCEPTRPSVLRNYLMIAKEFNEYVKKYPLYQNELIKAKTTVEILHGHIRLWKEKQPFPCLVILEDYSGINIEQNNIRKQLKTWEKTVISHNYLALLKAAPVGVFMSDNQLRIRSD